MPTIQLDRDRVTDRSDLAIQESVVKRFATGDRRPDAFPDAGYVGDALYTWQSLGLNLVHCAVEVSSTPVHYSLLRLCVFPGSIGSTATLVPSLFICFS